jgi:hypothetical protein
MLRSITRANTTKSNPTKLHTARMSGTDRMSGTETLENGLSSDILGSLNVARYSLLVGSRQGILVLPLRSDGALPPASQPSNLVARSVPVLQIPPAPQRFLGRQAAIAQAITAIQAGRSLEVVAAPGMGKSAFLRHLAHRPEVTTSHPDGILYLYRAQPLADLLQAIGEHFYVIYPDSKLTPREWQVSLQELQILIVLADPAWLSADMQALRQMLSNSTFLVVSLTPRSLDHLESLPLVGLSRSESCQLAAQIFDREMTPIEQSLVDRAGQQFQGSPARLVQMLELVHQGRLTWSHCERVLLAPDVAAPLATQRLIQQALMAVSTPQRWILGLLSALEGVGLTAQQIASMTGPQEPQASLQGLVRLALVQQLAGRYSLPSHVRSGVAEQFDSQPWMERGAAVLSAWLAQQPPEVILPEVPVAMVFLRWALQQKRWALVLDLARSLDSTLAIGKQWEEWRRVLQWALQAAWQLQDPVAEAWAWHQLGVRALCLEDVTTAYDALHQALRLRQGLGDAQAIALTERNLHYSMQGTLPPTVRSEVREESQRWRTNMALVIISLVTFLLTVCVGLGVRYWWQQSQPEVPVQDGRTP